ncbi:MAG: hypothetical protein NC082_00265 [Clostridiales bacterium]|nr:hypothetical protein [Clostridiales bacterium]
MNEQLLQAAYMAWSGASSFRMNRNRYKRFTYGDQWGDMVVEGDKVMTARERALSHGRRPMTNNLLRRLVKSVVGRYRYRRAEEEALEGKTKEVYEANCLDELDCRALEEFLISGCTVQRIARERRLQGEGVWVDMVSPDDFFVNRIRDPRGWDTELVGMIHDWSLGETVLRLGGSDYRRCETIKKVYGEIAGGRGLSIPLGSTSDSKDFFNCPGDRCRVIEVWTLEVIDRLCCHDSQRATYFYVGAHCGSRIDSINRTRSSRGEPLINTRRETATMWRCRWLAPDGTLLHSHISDAPDGRHPFYFRFYPMIDGEVHSLVEDVIDQQIYINELISLIDHVVSCSAKGVLLFPADEKIPTMSWSDVTQRWSMPDGVLPIRGRINNKMPQQVIATGQSMGAKELLMTQMQMFEDVSGVSNALMGRGGSGAVGAEHYENQVKQAIIAITDLLDTFANFIEERNSRLAQ